MSFSTNDGSLPYRFFLLLNSFLQRPGLPFSEALSEHAIQSAFEAEGATFAQDDNAIYTPAITLWAWLSQALHKNEHRSCLAAVSRVTVLLIGLGRRPCSDSSSGTYCKARAKLPEAVLWRLVYDVADGCQREAPDEWLWLGRPVKLVDGTTLSMPDTADNQQTYPQNPVQKEGLGFPIARIVVLISLTTAMVTGAAIGPYSGKETGETALLRRLFDRLNRGDVLLADRYFCSYFLICLLQGLGVDIVTRLHQCRDADFCRGKKLRSGDHVVEWSRPLRPKWMDAATYATMPATLQVRETRVKVSKKGFRTNEVILVTTLLDARAYEPQELADLFRQRWAVELDIRAIKCAMGMDVLRCLSAEMVRKEILIGLLAYNLIRRTILQSAQASGRLPRQVSFTAALQKIAASWVSAPTSSDEALSALIASVLKHLHKHRVGHRPDRVEPRAVKRRPKALALLTVPRAQARADLLAETPA